jgi:hypothetical protein
MKRKIIAITLALMLLLPALAAAEGETLPFGLALGMDGEQTRAAFAADATLSSLTPDKSDYGNGAIEYVFENVTIPGTDLTADSLSVQIDQNNSQKAERLTSVGFTIDPVDDSVAAFRKVLAALAASMGEPESDPFGADAVDTYVEWGTLSASWSTPSMRVALTMNRMYEESLTLQFTSRLNYDKADLGL